MGCGYGHVSALQQGACSTATYELCLLKSKNVALSLCNVHGQAGRTRAQSMYARGGWRVCVRWSRMTSDGMFELRLIIFFCEGLYGVEGRVNSSAGSPAQGMRGEEMKRTADVSGMSVCMCMCERAEGGPLEARGYGVTIRDIDLLLQQVLRLTCAARGVTSFGDDSVCPPARCC